MRCYRVQVFHTVHGTRQARQFYFNSEHEAGPELADELNRTFVALGIEEVECFATNEVAKLPIRPFVI